MAKLFLGADHAGYGLKEKVKDFLEEEGIEYEDLTPDLIEGDDYPDQAEKVARRVAEEDAKGIIMCGTGIGVSIAANKIDGIRAARCATPADAEMAAKHNHANILTMGGRTTTSGTAKRMVKAWLESEEEGGRHERRVKKIDELNS